MITEAPMQTGYIARADASEMKPSGGERGKLFNRLRHARLFSKSGSLFWLLTIADSGPR
jgi:hypothetical protein